MATITTSIGSNSSIDTQTPSGTTGSGPWVVTFVSDPTGISVGDKAFIVDNSSMSDYSFRVTTISGSDITLTYVSDTMDSGDADPIYMVDDDFVSQAPVVFQRFYSTITLWEAALDSDAGGSGNDAVGECYNDSVFDEGFSIDDTTPDSIKLTVAAGEEHDGIAGTGARIVCTGTYTFEANSSVSTTIEKLEIDHNGQQSASNGFLSGSETDKVNRILLHDLAHNGWIRQFRSVVSLSNTIIYNTDNTAAYGGTYGIECGGCYTSNLERHNCTVWNTTSSNNTDPDVIGIRGACSTGNTRSIKNCISINTGTNADADFSIDVTHANTTVDYNMSADSSATGSNSITGVSDSTQFVSTVNGSEDLHLKTGADALRAGVDLGTTNGVNIDINGSDRDVLTATLWDMGAHQLTSTASIGTTGRDYSTITLWEADLDDATIYGAGANAVGECYNDTTFGEAGISIADGYTVGLNSITLSVATGERHDGTAGSGARILQGSDWGGSGDGFVLYASSRLPVIIEWLEFDQAGYEHNNSGDGGIINAKALYSSDGYHKTVRNCLIYHATYDKSTSAIDISDYRTGKTITNNIIYRIGINGSYPLRGISIGTVSHPTYVYNNTIHNVLANTTTANRGIGISASDDDAELFVKNNLVTDCGNNSGNQCFEDTTYSTASFDYNASTDTTAKGTNSLNSITSANQYVSNTEASEDLHLKDNADALRAGVDLGATPTGVEIDIDARDRDSAGDDWDIGADQCESCSVGGGSDGILVTAGGAPDSFSIGGNGFGSNFSLD